MQGLGLALVAGPTEITASDLRLWLPGSKAWNVGIEHEGGVAMSRTRTTYEATAMTTRQRAKLYADWGGPVAQVVRAADS